MTENTLIRYVTGIGNIYISNKEEYQHLLGKIDRTDIEKNIEKYNGLPDSERVFGDL